MAVALAGLPVLTVSLAGPAQAAVSVSRAEVSADKLRIEGQAAASRPITVDGVSMTTSSSTGSFRIDRSGYRSPADCNVDVSDGSATAVNVRLAGCTVSTPPPAPAAALQSVSLSPASVEGGTTATGTVTLSAAAPSAGAVVALSSSNPSVVTVPPSVTVPSGASSSAVSVSTSSVTSTATSVVTATYNGVNRTATLTVTPPASQPPPTGTTLDSMVLDPSTVQTGTTQSSATVYFTAPTPPEGAVLTLASSNTSIATVPSTVTVPGYSSAGAFPVTISSSIAGSATISATYNGVTRSAVLTVTRQTLLRFLTDSALPHATRSDRTTLVSSRRAVDRGRRIRFRW